MDAKRLIAEVYKRPALWNQRHTLYHNRDVTNRVWMEIATLFKLPKQILKSKWKGLRDTFRAEIKKEQAYKKTKLGQNRPVWKHFKTLQFLKEQMLPKPPIWERASCDATNGNITAARESAARDNGASSKPLVRPLSSRRRFNNNNIRVIDASDSISKIKFRYGSGNSSRAEHENSRESSRENVMTTVLTDFQAVDTVAAHLRHEAADSINDNCNESATQVFPIKIEPAEHCEVEIPEVNGDNPENPSASEIPGIISDETSRDINDPDGINLIDGAVNDRYDDNYYFFVSLLPHIRTLSAERRMLLRMQMQQLVYEEVYKKSPAPSSISQRVIVRTNATPDSGSLIRDK
ncbi:uncharacterized protein [Venturia canescens]|uniref:uncharacterized protein n=1 Tax=Venturia canescens TaxID=32260 RepID=UPI001C9D43F7|nr:uncharacterized protein LOC122407669 [Venturia canescens]